MSAKRTPGSAEREVEAIRLVSTGMSRAAAAREMGVTKNVVVGLLDRAARLGNYTRPIADAHEPAAWRPPEPAHNGCRWIFGDPWVSEWRWCGRPVHGPGASWCADHASRLLIRWHVP